MDTNQELVWGLDSKAPTMSDFIWTLTLKGTPFAITMNECNDDTPWVGDILSNGAAVSLDEVTDAVEGAFDMEAAEAAEWLTEALQKRLDFQRMH